MCTIVCWLSLGTFEENFPELSSKPFMGCHPECRRLYSQGLFSLSRCYIFTSLFCFRKKILPFSSLKIIIVQFKKMSFFLNLLIAQSLSKGSSICSGPIWDWVWWGKGCLRCPTMTGCYLTFKNITRLTGIRGWCSWDCHGNFSDSTAWIGPSLVCSHLLYAMPPFLFPMSPSLFSFSFMVSSPFPLIII